jgi:anti-sigma B factor antagonist
MIAQYSTSSVEPDITVLNFAGQLTLGNRLMEIEYDIKERIDKGARKLVVDVGQLTYIDSAGLGTVAISAGRVERVGGKLVVAGAHGKVRQVIELARLHQVLGLYDDVAAACAALNDSAGTVGTA